MLRIHGVFSTIIIYLSVLGKCYNLKNTYMAAVVDYVHTYEKNAQDLLAVNVKEYEQLIRNASRDYADIIVFPEYGLIDIITMYALASKNVSDLEPYSTFVPDPESNYVPCDDKKAQNVSMHLVKLSCAARDHILYTVVNLLEKETNKETGVLDFFNTNVVFDRFGVIKAKYRKIHLSEEPFLQPGNEIITFTTDFGVTFGILTCFDLLFQYPALDMLAIANVTDIIFPTSWYSETPFLQALSIQHGYSKANGINLLASGLQDPLNQDGGSGVYLADGTIAEAFITNTMTTKIVVQEVPIIKNKKPANMCMHSTTNIKNRSNKKTEESIKNDIDNFPITPEDLSDYIFEPLAEGMNTHTQICSAENEFCCTFNITIDKSSKLKADYSYMMAIYQGLSRYGSNIMGGIRACAVLACFNETTNSCGKKINSSLISTKFANIEITALTSNADDIYIQPSTLRQDLMPISDYIYCEFNINNGTETKIIIATTMPEESILSFGLYGRIYTNDVVITPPPPPEPTQLNYTLIILIVSFSVIIVICTAGLLYKFCMKED